MLKSVSIGRSTTSHQLPMLRLFSAFLIAAFLLVPGEASAAPSVSANSCQLQSPKGNIQHVIYIQFDNTHFLRANTNVPTDLEQIPHRLTSTRNNAPRVTT